MAWIAFTVFSYCLLIAVLNLVRTWQSLRWIRDQQAVAEDAAPVEVDFVILVPLLREQAVVAQLVDRLAALHYPDDRLQIVLITTARETPGQGPTTADTLAELLRKRGERRFLHVHCNEGTDTCKADQLNFALRRLGLLGERRTGVFIGVYDADSSPDPRILRYLAWQIHLQKEAKAFQQVPIYFQNTHRIPRSVSGCYVLARPFHNALFALTMEVPEMRLQTLKAQNPSAAWAWFYPGWLSHAIGHGEFFRLDVLTDLGGFVAPSCDTQFGHALAYAGIPLQPVPLLDVGQTPESARILFRQGIVWYNSLSTFWKTRRLVIQLAPPGYRPFRAALMTARLLHSNLAWAFYPVLFLACLLWSAAAGHWLLLGYGLAAWTSYLAPVALIMADFPEWQRIVQSFEPIAPFSRPEKGAILLMYGVEKVGASLSPWWWLLGKLHEFLRGKPIALSKTERT
jgi:cellulose synthase/poly-beta-1,6-N-acetylglucosamine synthase-like glycosyltransferase